jgi:hypothetical protein
MADDKDRSDTAAAKERLERRGFLRGFGLAAGGAAAAAATAAVAAEDAGEERAEGPEEQVKPRYQESDHVRRFYALNRL